MRVERDGEMRAGICFGKKIIFRQDLSTITWIDKIIFRQGLSTAYNTAK